MKKPLILHPFLFAIFPILFLFVHNRGWITDYSEIILPLAAVLGATVLLFFLLTIILKDSKKAGIIVSLFVILFFFYGHLYEMAYARSIELFPFGRHRYLLPTFGLLFVLGTYFSIRTRKSLRALTNILNVTAFSLVLIPLINLGLYETGSKTVLEKTRQDNEINTISKIPAERPDIYYIILDTYAGSKTLKDIFGYDNSEFTNFLTQKGFYIADKSLSNYGGTTLSLPSSLNMEYLDDALVKDGKPKPENVISLIRNNRVLQFLKSKGYTTVNLGHWWEPTSYNEYADINFQGGRYASEFSRLFLRTTALAPFIQSFLASKTRDGILNMFDILAEIPQKVESPKFVFVHFLAPHSPFVIGANGEEVVKPVDLNKKELGEWKKNAYLNQLIFINKKIKEVINAILEQSKAPPIILIQSDHGPGEAAFRNFSSYYLPGDGKEILYDSITPVNSFRLIFNHYFNASYELLPDRAYEIVESDMKDSYKFIDVTDQVKYD
ncbi:sulfatase-like hydrolase/transferase [Patescibacteria group bacterium]|nr:sulfatase-like hydrolase/transferase [Patescibacteria group bacterium]